MITHPMAAPAQSRSTDRGASRSAAWVPPCPIGAYIGHMTALQSSSAEFNAGAMLGVEVATNGPQGGDAGHGGRVEVVLTNLAMMDMGDEHGHKDRLVIQASGDMEMSLLASGLLWAGQELLRLNGMGAIQPEMPTGSLEHPEGPLG